jgi:hypothetical protein
MPTSTNTLITCATNKAGEYVSSNAIMPAVISEWHLVTIGQQLIYLSPLVASGRKTARKGEGLFSN